MSVTSHGQSLYDFLRTKGGAARAVSQLLWTEKIARCGFPWEKTTKRPVAPRISCGAALAENNYVRLSSRKVACSSAVPPTSTGNPGSVYTNCETARVFPNRREVKTTI